MQTMKPVNRTAAINTLLIACGITFILYFLPFGDMLLYPIRLFVTFIHESSHAVAALITGGRVEAITIEPNASGQTLSAGGFLPFIVMAGYVGATAFGAWLIYVGRKPVSSTLPLDISAAIIGLATAIFVHPWMNLFGFFWGIVITIALIITRNRLKGEKLDLLIMFLGVQCAINALSDLRTLVGLSTMYYGVPTDAVLMSRLFPLPPVFWALVWSGLSLFILWRGLKPYFAKG